jgi:hypothetical protein
MATKKSAKKLSQIEAAAKVLAATKKPMTCRELVEAMQAKRLWESPGGKTPHATLYASILRDLNKGKDARFKKTAPGKFALAKTRKGGSR